MKRQDIHRPSMIVPDEYEYIAEEFIDVKSLGDALCMKAHREIIAAHRARTGGSYSQHEHGGNCMVCGSVNALYTSLFYHAKTNSYVRMGHDCADKCDCGGSAERNNFRRAVQDAREAHAGKNKAKAILSDANLSQAWDIFSAPNDGSRDGYEDEEMTIIDIVSRLVRYGSISDKAMGYIKVLLSRIPERAARKAQREAEQEAAAPCPTGRLEITGEVIGMKVQESYFGDVTKILVKADSGFKVWGSRFDNVHRGDRVRFTATVEPSADDPKFGFFKRPRAYVSAADKAALKAEQKRLNELIDSSAGGVQYASDARELSNLKF
jgi:hypothetical protein